MDNEQYIEYYINSEVKEIVFEVSDFKDMKDSEFLEAVGFNEEKYKKLLDEKKKFIKWIKREPEELSDTRYIFLNKIDRILKNNKKY